MTLLSTSSKPQATDNIVDFISERNSRIGSRSLSLHVAPLDSHPALREHAAQEYLDVQETMRQINIQLYELIEQLQTLEQSTEIVQIVSNIKKRIFRNAFRPALPASLAELQRQLQNINKEF